MRLSRSIAIICGVTLIVNAPLWGGWLFYKHLMQKKRLDPIYIVTTIESKTEGDEILRPEIIAEWLNLSVERKVNLYAIDLRKAAALLKKQMIVRKVAVTRKPPSVLAIEAEIRKPVAFVGERSNIALDKEGNVFPFHPFYTPKKLPKLYIGKKENFTIAQKVLEWFIEKGLLESVDSIDVRSAKALSLGEREVVVVISGRYGRLNPEALDEGLERFMRLSHLKEAVIDLRVEGMALVTKSSKE